MPANFVRSAMNRFLNRKKPDENILVNDDALAQLSSASPLSPGLKKSGTSRWKKNKKQPEQKPEVNIAAVLPPSDDFRTSLLMPNLSARFSMLREQDDPNSLLGKASDDSVLQPNRRSRMLDFGFPASNLGDIAEVRSINSSIRPPFAQAQRTDSYGSEDGYGSENDSVHAGNVMSRARPGEGNVLFGGRQKVYMIPKGGAMSTKSLGKAVYEDDIGKSAFQKHRQRERELQEAREAQMAEDPENFDFGLGQAWGGDEDERATATPNDSARDLSHSPSLSSNDKKRSTSSIARSEARSSTAATSVASQSAANLATYAPAPPPTSMPPAVPALERSNTKGRRLYEQGLDQHMHEQQTSALTRLNSIQRQRTMNQGKASPPILYSAKSATSLHERQPHNVYALRAQSPPPLGPLTTFATARQNGESPITSGPNSPLSPPLSDMDESSVLNQALEPGDRGKATAMAVFNKPNGAFDEKQYLERQIQLQRSNSSAMVRQPSSSALQGRLNRMNQLERERSASNPVGLTRSSSLATKQHEPSNAFNVFQNAASRNQSLASEQQPDVPSVPAIPELPQENQPSYPDTHRTFFGNISASDSEDEYDEPYRTENPYGYEDYNHGPYGKWQPSSLASVSEHPALRSEAIHPALLEEDEEEEEEQQAPSRTQAPVEVPSEMPQQDAFAPPSLPSQDLDSPTLGPSAEGLGHMMHHLRSKSTASSTYPHSETDQVPDLPNMSNDFNHRPMRSTYGSESRIDSTYTNSNPWDLDENDSSYYFGNDSASRSSVSPVDGARARGTYASSRAPSMAATHQDRRSEVFQDLESIPWQAELGKQHARNASTATQQERSAFDDELAARRVAIQEKVKNKLETEQARGVSPAPSAGGALKAFGLLRSKPSRDSIAENKSEAPSKAMKMLGIGSGSTPASSTNLNAQFERGGASLDMNRPRGNSGSRSQLSGRILQQSGLDAKRERERSRARGDSEASRFDRPVGRSPGTSSELSRTARSRSNSVATNGRSRSRTGPYRDDLEKAMVEGTGSSAAGVPDISPLSTRELTPRPSPDVQQQGQFDGRNRSNSRVNAMTNYFDSKHLQPLPTAQNRFGTNGVSSPGVPPVPINGYTPSASSVRSTPAASPYVQTATPPLSGADTPVGASFHSPQMPQGPALRNGPLRKKTISKSDISEPVKLLSSTSTVDLVDLPVGASLKNGMDSPPPVPAIHPRRRGTRKLFGVGRTESNDYVDAGRSKTPDPFMGRTPESGRPDIARHNTAAPAMRSRNVSSPKRPFDSSPAVHQYSFEQTGYEQTAPPQHYGNNTKAAVHPYGYEQHAMSSPERIERGGPPSQPVQMEGGFI